MVKMGRGELSPAPHPAAKLCGRNRIGFETGMKQDFVDADRVKKDC